VINSGEPFHENLIIGQVELVGILDLQNVLQIGNHLGFLSALLGGLIVGLVQFGNGRVALCIDRGFKVESGHENFLVEHHEGNETDNEADEGQKYQIDSTYFKVFIALSLFVCQIKLVGVLLVEQLTVFVDTFVHIWREAAIATLFHHVSGTVRYLLVGVIVLLLSHLDLDLVERAFCVLHYLL
jgi:hypothetical protein